MIRLIWVIFGTGLVAVRTFEGVAVGGVPAFAGKTDIALENLGRDILEDKRTAKANARRVGGIPTFREAADRVIESRRPTWSNDKHAAQWISSLHHSAAPLGCRKVSEITTADILEVLEPLMVSAPIIASRTRQRLEHVFKLGDHQRTPGRQPGGQTYS